MAINIKFDLSGNPELPTIILANRNGNKLGQLDVNVDSIELTDKLNDASEFAFTLNKYVNGELTNLWDKVVDFKLIYCKEWDCWFEIKVELDEATETVKTVYCTQLGQAELSQIMLYDIEINTEEDIERDDYKISILYDKENPKSSILNRLLEKAPHYSIAYVDSTIARIQRSFSFDDTSICDAFNEIAEEIGCLFVYDSNSDENGMPKRTISVYDLYQNCNDCDYRGEFVDVCPKCGSTNIKNGYGEDTLIFVTSDELASEGIQLVTDTDSVKNCFRLEGGDDLMTATIRNCNPNGTNYIWYFSDSIKEDMPKELVEKIESYDETYRQYYNNHASELDADLLSHYNILVNKYSVYNKDLQTISTPIIGYSDLMNAYYNTIDLAWYLKSELMPNVEMSDTNAKEQAKLLTSSALSPVAVANINTVSLATANSSVLAMAKTIVRSTFKVQVKDSALSADRSTWTGNFIVTNYSDEEDTAVSNTVSVSLSGDDKTFIQQKIEKALNKENTDDYSISGLFEKGYNDFCNELKKYALNPLLSFRDTCQVCIDILMEQGVGGDIASDLYTGLYNPYYSKLMAVESEIKIREEEINYIVGVYDAEGNLVTKGLQTNIEECKTQIQDALNFEDYLGKKLWLDFCTYRREDKYSNENYISDGLNNAELFERALEFVEVAENEIYKSSELQRSISTTLNNLLAIPKFKSLAKYFKVGNWIRVQIDDEIYKLRLIEYTINYNDFESISVEFSDVTKVKNGFTDIEDILAQASSMASSYDSIKRQSKQGNEAQGVIEQWLEDGLNSALVQIQNNANEEIIITKSGLLGRSYSDITGTYSPEQFKLTHNIMAYTNDNWKTVSSALGKHEYTKWKDSQWVKDIDYGFSSKFVTAGYIAGSQIIGGEIISSNYKSGESGTYFNLIDGDFEIAGGKIVYEAKENEVTLNGVKIKWDTVNPPSIANIDGLSDEIKKIDALNFQETEITGQYIISPLIGGGYLDIWNTKDDSTENNPRVIIDPNNLTGNGYIFQVHDGKNIVAGIDISGKAVFQGDIIANSLTLGNDTIDELSKVAITGLYEHLLNPPDIPKSVKDLGFDEDKVIYKGDIKQTVETDDNGVYCYKTIVPTGEIDENGKSINIEYVTYDADDYIVFGREKGTDEDKKDYFCLSKEGLLRARNAVIYGDLHATSGEFTGTIKGSTIIGTSTLYLGEEVGEDGKAYKTWITEDGVLNTRDANISGTITASDGIIGGWYITDDALSSSDTIVNSNIFLDPSGKTATIADIERNAICLKIGNDFGVSSGGRIYGHHAILTGKTLTEDIIISGDVVVQGDSTVGDTSGGSVECKSLYIGDSDVEVFAWITEDGVLNARGANISGETNITGGTVGGCSIVDGVLQITNDNIAGLITAAKLDADYLNADDVVISGEITATKGSKIGDWTVGTFNTLSCNYSSISDSQFVVGSFNASTVINPGEIIISDVSYSVNLTGEGFSAGIDSVTWERIGDVCETNNGSDIRIKNSIELLNDNYERFFNLLLPKRYKYNNGTSNRYHTGFIAQEVVSALEESQLSTQDFAAVMLENPDTADECWYLRRDEFVALNTWQIQKAKSRITALEEYVEKLEERIALLEKE